MSRKKMIIWLICFFNVSILSAEDLLVVDGKPFFASGMNLAWMSFANDLSGFSATTFTSQVKKLASSGGNTMRWWLHVNGTSTPTFKNDTVSGISTTAINNLKRALDTAYKYNVRLVLCLWSFDMLQDNAGSANWPRNKKLLEDSMATAAYIRNALTPMVNALKGHPGILCWEVFNEPEGMSTEFGWTPVKTSMKAIQAFTNRVAGAIHRLDSTAKVSNGSWNIKALTDVNGMFNYYRDDRLIAAGGDSLGTLDFYMVHYYNAHFGTSESPFHHPKSYWQLDKPLVIGEFPAKGMYGGQLITGISPIEAFNFAYNNGYAGALSWTMTGHDGNGSLTETGPALENLVLKHADTLQIDKDRFNFSPQFIKRPDDILAGTRGQIEITLSAKNLIYDPDDTLIVFEISNISNTNLVSVQPVNDSVIVLNINDTIDGVAKITVKATDVHGKSSSSYFIVYAYSLSNTPNKALYRKVTASSEVDPNQLPYMVTDGKTNTAWWGAVSKYEYITIEFEESKTFNTVKLLWGGAYGRKYYIETSNNGTDWDTILNVTNGIKGLNTHVFNTVNAKFLKIDFYGRSSNDGYVLYEVEVYHDTISAVKNIESSLNELIVFPNPAQNYIHIQLNDKSTIREFKIYNTNGQVVKRFPVQLSSTLIDISDLPAGNYLVLTQSNKQTFQSVFIKK